MKLVLLSLGLLFALASANDRNLDEGRFCNKNHEGLVRCFNVFAHLGHGSNDIGVKPEKATQMKQCIRKHWVMAANCPPQTYCRDFNPIHNPDISKVPLCINPRTDEMFEVPIHL